MKEFNQIIKDRAAIIKKSIIDPPKAESTPNKAEIMSENTD
jgi:hypothetical protein